MWDLAPRPKYRYHFHTNVFYVSRQIYHEAYHVFHDDNMFVRLVCNHPSNFDRSGILEREGLVVLAKGADASNFRDCAMEVTYGSMLHVHSYQGTPTLDCRTTTPNNRCR